MLKMVTVGIAVIFRFTLCKLDVQFNKKICITCLLFDEEDEPVTPARKRLCAAPVVVQQSLPTLPTPPLLVDGGYTVCALYATGKQTVPTHGISLETLALRNYGY